MSSAPAGAQAPPRRDAGPAPSTGADTQPPNSYSDWQVGEKPLPVRSDGFGEVLPTPPELRQRRLPTPESLATQPDDRFRSSVHRIGPEVRERMGESWRPGCPMDLDDLRYVRLSFWGFDDRAHVGELIVHHRAAQDITRVFEKLFRAEFPIERMRIVTSPELPAEPTGDGNNTAAFVCRQARQQADWSAHAYGLAVDINPFQNPYHRDDLVLPERASAYLDRSRERPGMIHPDGVVTRAFAEVDWTWGGSWHEPRDYMHFSATGH
ncbi:D-alanyl-D-alanine carboxypeptidase [Haloechinothrix alba]|uniref:D-alanyl-D-alanine carboxypeptidase n=2 Tax=Haloechinothrix alba TaxID=664784 RepID=A0A238XEK1_9PSEU|nr:D-alanyl-D-alanine carboxypeptidase [Haloechinothrix alba]